MTGATNGVGGNYQLGQKENPYQPIPQGLRPDADTPNPDCPHLGFNPTPGDCDTVRALHKKLVGCAKVLRDTHGVVTKLMDGGYWKGDAAVAFREQIEDGPLPKNLENAATSIGRAARHLHRWHDELADFQDRAKGLNREAKSARAALDAARGDAASAGDDPDVKKKSGASSGKHEDALRELKRAHGRVDEAQEELDRILRRARNLAYEHERKANYRAEKIRDATHKLAPHEPGWFEKAVDWVEENLPDILSAVAAVVGLVAIIFAGPLGAAMVAALLLASSALSAGALGLRLLGDPTLRASLMDGFAKGEFDMDFWSNVVTVGGDFLGTVPGLGAAWKGGAAALRAGGEAGQAPTLGQRLARFGGSTMEHAGAISTLDNSLLNFTIRGARAEQVTRTVEVTSAVTGVATAGIGLVSKAMDADDDGIKDGAVAGIDGARLGLDGGGVFEIARHVFTH
ncbi:putative T7SS-secreted protein [Streptomyces sp. NPDC059009]|uniref:putative T7SS-secreted protein n=1 Tax=Streptomyces sp. NPDC059009 TaxID=3346694 RepID=UPI0036942D39